MKTAIPLSLYVHIPWCVQKCPYCDFNSHTQKAPIPELEYIHALLDDLNKDLNHFPEIKERPLHSIFIGGGTPSLISPQNIATLIKGINTQFSFNDNIEITMEANPGTLEANNFLAYKKAGVNRISIGIQSFDNEKLARLGRIHDAEEGKRAATLAKDAKIPSFNLDLMHGLPNQSQADALHDLEEAISLAPTHLSWYQLTIEPNTQYYSHPPQLPDEDELWNIFTQGEALLEKAGYIQYETSAYSRIGYQCRHNLNYWRFGDYLGIGCGAHGKITSQSGSIFRTVKVKHPRGYLDKNKDYLSELNEVNKDDLPFEFFMNRFRLLEPCPKSAFLTHTQLTLSAIDAPIQCAIEQGFLQETATEWRVTKKGRLFLNDLIACFLSDDTQDI